jgi:hypothetical protein
MQRRGPRGKELHMGKEPEGGAKESDLTNKVRVASCCVSSRIGLSAEEATAIQR